MYFAILSSPLLKKVKACQHLDCGQMQGKSFGSFWLFWTQLRHWCSLKALWEDVKKKPLLAFYKWTHYSPLRGSLWWGGRRLTVVTWIEGVGSGAGLLWCGHAVCRSLVWLGDSGWIPPHRCPTNPTKMLHIPTSLSPLDPLSGFTLHSWGPGILCRHFRVSQDGCWSKQLDSGPPDLAWTRPGRLFKPWDFS